VSEDRWHNSRTYADRWFIIIIVIKFSHNHKRQCSRHTH